MVVTELDSFLTKFNQLWSAGHSAHLDLESHSGRAWVGLCVQLGHVPPGHLHHPLNPPQPQEPYRNGKPDSPFRQRRRERRAAAHKNEAEEASKKENAEVADPTVIAETAVHEENSEIIDSTDQNDETPVEEAEKATKDMEISDEVCPDVEYDDIDDDDAPVKEILLESVYHENFDEEAFKDHLDYNMKLQGINMLETQMKKSESGEISCSIIIHPTQKEIIKRLSLALKGWKVKPCHR